MLINKIFGTVGARLLSAILSFTVLIVSTHSFGADGYGVITMIILSIMFIGMFNDLMGGGALVYLIPRNKLSELLSISYTWSFFTALAGSIIAYFFDKELVGPYALHVFFLAVLHNWFTINQKVLLGKERIGIFNILIVIQLFILLSSLFLFVNLMPGNDPILYIYALYFSYGLAFLISFSFVFGYLKSENNKILIRKEVVKRVISLGFYTQIANLTQFFNYRLTYYFIQTFWISSGGSAAPLGVYGSTNKIVEGNWLVSKSLSLVQYSVLANREGEDYAQNLTLSFLKLSFFVTFLITLVLVILPGTFYEWLFGGQEFQKIPQLILLLSPGILAVSLNNSISHYFAGKGLQRINAIGSLLGFSGTVIAGLLLVPVWGLTGAAITSSIAHVLGTGFMIYIFIRKTQIKTSDFCLKRTDLNLVKKILANRKNKNS
ncbi:MAG: polysaccharide biosynthesis C-terminal domain-containing protein [Bacteroidales bacterium]|nr:polysaccharide biosynthesis C-terminal domain-containing protein [Bacteroidales bacterium]